MLDKLTTNGVALLKLISAIGYVAFKLFSHSSFTEAELGLVYVALSGALGNRVSADAKTSA